ncbi:CDP-alcohol phosphatidyltransferase, partial [Micromonospora sp. URMC 105]
MRRSSTFARQVLLVRVGRRDGDARTGTDLMATEHLLDRPRRYGFDRTRRAEIEAVMPVSPALAPASSVDDDSSAMSIPLLPGERTA